MSGVVRRPLALGLGTIGFAGGTIGPCAASRQRRALFVALLSLPTGCSTAGQRSTQPSPASTSAATSTTATAAPRCHPASPITLWWSFLPMAQGTGHGATLWGLLMFPHPLPARVGDQEKIVWRMTGTGPLTLTAIDPAGMNHQPAWVRSPT